MIMIKNIKCRPVTLLLVLVLILSLSACGKGTVKSASSQNTASTGSTANGSNSSAPAREFTVTYTGGEGAAGTGPKNRTVEKGERIAVAENTFTREGYTFKAWSDGSAAHDAGTFYTVESNVPLPPNGKRRLLT